MKQRLKTYKFWVALSASLVILAQTLGDAFGIEISGDIVNNITMAFCGVLVALGIVDKPTEKDTPKEELNTELPEIYIDEVLPEKSTDQDESK